MNTKDLMIHVERIVRPVRADASKLRMRRELLAHLQAAYEEERARGLDEPAALAEAKRRLGDPAEITRQLQASVSRLERLSVTPFPRWVRAVPVVAAILLPILVAILSAPAWLIVDHPERHHGFMLPEGISRHASLTLAGSIVAMEIYLALSYVCILKAMSIAKGITPRRWSWIAIFGVLVFVAQLIWTSLFGLAMTGEPRIDPYFAGASVITIIIVGEAVLISLISLPVREWLSLDIVETPHRAATDQRLQRAFR
jgi:hypothetical protein